jgi:hypothetical protein
MSDKQQFSPSQALSTEQEKGEEGEEEEEHAAQQKHPERRPLDHKKRALLKTLVKRNTSCHHLQIYTQANVTCRRISQSYEEGKISEKQAMELMFEAHEQMSHRGLPKEVVANEMHKRLDKLEGNDKTSFAIIMANTNSSVHVRGSNNKTDMKNTDTWDDSGGDNKYSESYWAEIM